ncbi:H-NS histone family protein [Salmonella enterica]|nr:H-NS histone family protein [Salmonella enterica]RVR82900.1 H-NS histone family protein [Citrobacter freundii]
MFVPLQSEKSPKGEPRYRDPANPFNTWVGRGKRPDWLKKYLDEGRELSEFEIVE